MHLQRGNTPLRDVRSKSPVAQEPPSQKPMKKLSVSAWQIYARIDERDYCQLFQLYFFLRLVLTSQPTLVKVHSQSRLIVPLNTNSRRFLCLYAWLNRSFGTGSEYSSLNVIVNLIKLYFTCLNGRQVGTDAMCNVVWSVLFCESFERSWNLAIVCS